MSERVSRSGVRRLRVAAVVMLVMVAAGAGAGRASATVSNASVSFTGSAQAGASPAWVNITFTTPHALSYSSGDTITIQAPQGTRWAAGEDYVVSNGFTECGIVYPDSPSVSPTGETVTIPAGNSACGNWGAGSTLTVSASNSTNPTVASPDYTMAVSTSRDPTPVASSPYTISPGPPSYLSTPGQNLYRGEVGANYNAPASGNARMQVIVADKYGNPTDTGGVKVTFTAPDSGPSGTFLDGTKSETVTTDASGTATADAFTANDMAVPGALYTVEATGSLPAGGPLNPGYFYYVQLPGPTARAVLLLSPPLVRADGSSTATATATVTDRFGNRISGDHFNTAGTEQFTERVGLASDGGQAISAVTNNRDGTYTATLTSIRTPEDSTITATAQDTPSSTAFTGSATLRQALAPSVSVAGASAITATEATLPGTVNPNGDAVTYYFEYGPTTSYGQRTPSYTVTADTSPHSVVASLTALQPATVYHYRLLASNGIGSVASGDGTFTTPTAPPPPSASAPPPPNPDTKGEPVSGPSLRFLGASAAAGRVRVLNGVALLLAKRPPRTPGGCTGTVTLQMTALVSTHTAASRKHHRRSRQMKIVRLGRALVSIPQGTAVKVKVRLSRMAVTLLAGNKPLRAVAIVVARDATGAAKTSSARIVLKVVAPPHRHKHTRAG